MNSASAEKRDYDVIEFNKNQAAKLVDIKKRRLEKEKEKKAAVHTFKNVIGSIILVIVMLSMFSMIVYRNSMVNAAKYEIFNLKTEINTRNTQIEELKASLESCTDIKTVESIAINELNMQYPKKEQYVYIQGTKQFALNDEAAPLASSTSVDGEVKEEGAGVLIPEGNELLDNTDETSESVLSQFLSAIMKKVD